MEISFSRYDVDGKYGKKNDYVIVAHIYPKFPNDFYVARGKNENMAWADLNEYITSI